MMYPSSFNVQWCTLSPSKYTMMYPFTPSYVQWCTLPPSKYTMMYPFSFKVQWCTLHPSKYNDVPFLLQSTMMYPFSFKVQWCTLPPSNYNDVPFLLQTTMMYPSALKVQWCTLHPSKYNDVPFSFKVHWCTLYPFAETSFCNLQGAQEDAPLLCRSTQSSLEKPKIINWQLRQLAPDKATGPDHIPSRVLKECSAELASPLSRLFKLCFDNGVFPSSRKTVNVVPIHKRDSKSDPIQYRPISLLSIISKLMESAVYLCNFQAICSRGILFLTDNSDSDQVTALPTS